MNRSNFKKTLRPQVPPLEPVVGSVACTFTPVENKLAALYRNQQKIYTLLQRIAANTTAKQPGIQSVLAEIQSGR
jgi:hypothetical protein